MLEMREFLIRPLKKLPSAELKLSIPGMRKPFIASTNQLMMYCSPFSIHFSASNVAPSYVLYSGSSTAHTLAQLVASLPGKTKLPALKPVV